MPNERQPSKLKSPPWAALALSGWALFIMGAVSPGSAPKLAVVDTSRITSGSTTVQAQIDKAAAGAEGIRKELKRKQDEYKSAAEKYSAQQGVATAAENEKRGAQLKTMKQDLEDMMVRLNREVEKAQEQAVAPMRDKIMKAVKEVSAAQGVGIVLNAEGVVYFDPATDLTAEVIKKLDGK